MRVKKEFVLRQIAGEDILIPTGDAAMAVNGMIALSESGGLLYRKLQTGCTREELIRALIGEYEVEESVAAEDVDGFLAQMRQLDLLAEDQ